VSTFEFGAGLLVLAAVVGVVDDRTLRLPRQVALLLASFPKLPQRDTMQNPADLCSDAADSNFRQSR
jgi:hypothetical protein